jgi:hypothetical protein
MLAYVLNKTIDSQKILADIQNLINNFPKEPSDSLVLTIKLVKIEQDTSSFIPKIEYKSS